MKKIVLTLTFALQSTILCYACTICQSQQPKVLQGTTHGTGPTSAWDYLIILSSCLVVLITLVMSLSYLIKPKEDSPNHIKNMILEEK